MLCEIDKVIDFIEKQLNSFSRELSPLDHAAFKNICHVTFSLWILPLFDMELYLPHQDCFTSQSLFQTSVI